MTILSKDRRVLVSIIISVLSRKGIEIENVSAARTDIHTRVEPLPRNHRRRGSHWSVGWLHSKGSHYWKVKGIRRK
jgi:hypothetical protein